MANFPGAWGVLPGVYGPTDHYFIYQGSQLRIGWAGGIFLDEGNWLDAAIALRIRMPKAFAEHENFSGWGHLKVDKNYDLSLHIIPEGTPFESGDHKWVSGKPNYEKESRENFPLLKQHYDKIKNLKAFW